MDKKVPEIRFKGFSKNWLSTLLEKISDVLDGDRGHNYPSGEELKSQGHTLFLSASNVTKNGFKLDIRQYVTREKSESLGNGKLIINDIVLTSRGSIGHIVWYDENIAKEIPFARINSGMLILRVNNSIDSCAISQYLKSPQGKKKIETICFGSAQPQLTKAGVSKLSVIMPNKKSEQTAIGNYFQKLDTLINQHQQKHDKLTNIKKAMLEKMFPKQGESIPEIRFKGFSGEWKQKKLGEIGDTFTGLSGKTKDDFGHGQGRFVTYLNVFSNAISNENLVESIEIDTNQNEVKKGDVFFTTSSETPEEVGMSSIWMRDTKNVYLNSFCFGYRPKQKFDNYYLAYMLRSNSFREKMVFLAQGISRYNISKTKVMDIKISIPDFAEQEKIGNYFQKLNALINQHQQQITKLNNIKQACLSKMFV